MTVAVASGKGGTGKTTVAVNLAFCLEKATLVDCDVEEPNAHIFLEPQIERVEYVNTKSPRVTDQLCDLCGKCAEFCRYNAIAVLGDRAVTFPELCHHCGGCAIACPKNAIFEVDTVLGRVEEGKARGMRFIQGITEVGLTEATPIICREKELAGNSMSVILDAPAGTSCLMVETVEGSDFCILVTEPTPFGLNDLALAVQVVRDYRIPFGVVINQSDIGDRKVWEYCGKESIPILLEIPYDRGIAESYSRGDLLSEAMPEYKETFERLWRQIQESL